MGAIRWLPTFCQLAWRTTCYCAANRIRVGQIQSHGKLDPRNEYALPVKDIPLKPIHPRRRSILNRITCPLLRQPL